MSSMSALVREFEVAARLPRPPAAAQALVETGLRLPAGQDWGMATVAVGGPFYEPAPEGPWAVIVPAVEDDVLVDLVAASLRPPSVGRAVRRRRGDAQVLGYDRIGEARWFERPLTLFDDPVEWLLADGQGIVVLDWRVAPGLLADLPGLVCQSDWLANRVARAFARPIPLPPLYVPPAKEIRHAA
jgi:hypothetical protein